MNHESKISIFDAYIEYLQQNLSSNVDKMLNTVFMRFLIPAWGGKPPVGVRATNKDLNSALDFIKSKPISLLDNADSLLENSLSKQEISLSNRRVYRSILKGFLDWLKISKQISEPENILEKQENITDVGFGFKKGKGFYSSPNCSYHGLKRKEPYALLSHKEDYLNKVLVKELTDFENFRKKEGCSKGTIGLDLRNVKAMLGWLHRFKNIPLEELSLTKIIHPSVLLDHNFSGTDENWDKYITSTYKLKQKANVVAKNNSALIQEYLIFFSSHPKTESITLSTFISVSNYIFQDYIGTEEYKTNDSLPIIQQLRILKNATLKRAKITPDVVPYSSKSVPWDKALEVLDKLRAEANLTEYRYLRKRATRQIRTQSRRKTGIADSLQNFLIVAFLLVIPPLRPRVYYELEIGTTLVRGLFKNGIFISKDKLSASEESFWYIHLLPQQYKTGKVYKEYWKDVPNIKFPDGSFLYGYIEQWLDEYRDLEGLCEHQYFFRRSRLNTQFDHIHWRDRICNIFDRFTGVPVAPKEFRKMYVTFLKDSGVTEAQLEAAATAMQHSRRMQSTIYDQQTQIEKITPINEFIKKTFQEHWEKGNTQEEAQERGTHKPMQADKAFTRHNYSSTQALEEVRKLQKLGMSQEKIIGFLWDATPRARKKYESAIAEFEEIMKG